MSPKTVDRQSKKKEIGLAAQDHFVQNGFADTSISQIAKAADVGKGTIYEYFQSKDELISFALEIYVEKIEERTTKMPTGISNPKEQIRHYVFEMIETFMNDPRTMGLTVAIFQMLITDMEVGKYGITVNIVAPSPTQTGYLTPNEEFAIASQTPLRRIGRPEDVADVILLLASDQAQWLTGQMLYVGGGWRMHQ